MIFLRRDLKEHQKTPEMGVQYWEHLMALWQGIDFDVGSIIMTHLVKYLEEMNRQRKNKKVVHDEFFNSLRETCCNGIKRVKKEDIHKLCISKESHNEIRRFLQHKIGRNREELYVFWITPIDKIHTRNYYIAGIQGTPFLRKGRPSSVIGWLSPPGYGINFRAPYHLFQEICEKNEWREPESIKPWSGECKNIASLMLLQDGIIEV